MATQWRTIGSGWALEHPIGSGSFAVVWKAHHIHSGIVAAIKEVNTDRLNNKLQESLASEISVLERTKHCNLVGMLDLIKEPGKMFLVLEFCGGGDLGQYLRRYGRVDEATARFFMQQLAEGLKVLRTHNLIHRDLKPQNLLLSEVSKQPVLKIADFGFARDLHPQGMAETLCGSPLYMAPEILQFHKYDAKADLWSVGTILFEMLAGKPPFSGANHLQLLQNIERHEAKLPDAIAGNVSPACISLIHQLLRRNPLERISFEEFFVHPFFTGGSSSFHRPSPQRPLQPPPQQQPDSARAGPGTVATARAPSAATAVAGRLGPGEAEVPLFSFQQQLPPPQQQPSVQVQPQVGQSAGPSGQQQPAAPPLAQHQQREAVLGAGPVLAVDAATGITLRALTSQSRSPSPHFVVPLTSPPGSPERNGRGGPVASTAGGGDAEMPTVASFGSGTGGAAGGTGSMQEVQLDACCDAAAQQHAQHAASAAGRPSAGSGGGAPPDRAAGRGSGARAQQRAGSGHMGDSFDTDFVVISNPASPDTSPGRGVRESVQRTSTTLGAMGAMLQRPHSTLASVAAAVASSSSRVLAAHLRPSATPAARRRSSGSGGAAPSGSGAGTPAAALRPQLEPASPVSTAHSYARDKMDGLVRQPGQAARGDGSTGTTPPHGSSPRAPVSPSASNVPFTTTAAAVTTASGGSVADAGAAPVSAAQSQGPAATGSTQAQQQQQQMLLQAARLPEHLDALDLMQRVLLILVESARTLWDGAVAAAESAVESASLRQQQQHQQPAAAGSPATAAASASGAGSGGVAPGPGAVGPAASVHVRRPDDPAAAAAAATQQVRSAAGELLALQLFCYRLLEVGLLLEQQQQQPTGGIGVTSAAAGGYRPTASSAAHATPHGHASHSGARELKMAAHVRTLSSGLGDRAQAAARRLQQQQQPLVPRGVDVVYGAALRYSRAGGAEEMMGQYRGAVEQYAKAADLLLFMLTGAACCYWPAGGPAAAAAAAAPTPATPAPASAASALMRPGMAAEAKAEAVCGAEGACISLQQQALLALGAADWQRLHRHYTAVKLRQSACMAALNSR